MGMAMRGVTHCSECGSPLGMGEFDICQTCINEKNNKVKQEQEKRLERVLSIFDGVTNKEIVAFRRFLKTLDKEERKKEIQYRMSELQKELDNLNKE